MSWIDIIFKWQILIGAFLGGLFALADLELLKPSMVMLFAVPQNGNSLESRLGPFN